MLDDEDQPFDIGRELRAALTAGELELYYQPICDSTDLRLIAYESLARWRHPRRGTIPPNEFIPVAERSALIDDLGDWVLATACRDIRRLNVRYIGVNVSAAQLRREDFALRFRSAVRRAGIEPGSITVEITETVPLRQGGTASRTLHALRDLGCYVAIDDFGTGFASLEYLKTFPFNVLKIDKSYVRDLETSAAARAAAETLCDLGNSSEIVVVAEGVETEGQLLWLREAGCSRVQGFLIGRPAPLSRWLSCPHLDPVRLGGPARAEAAEDAHVTTPDRASPHALRTRSPPQAR